MTVTNLIKIDRKTKEQFGKCSSVNELNKALEELITVYTKDDELDIVTDNYLKSLQRMQGIERNTKYINEYSWLTTRQLHKAEKRTCKIDD